VRVAACCGGARLVDRDSVSTSACEGWASRPWATTRIGWGGCGWKLCPCVAESCRSYNHSHRRTESVGEGVAKWRPCVAWSTCVHSYRQVCIGEGVAETGVRVTRGRVDHRATVTPVWCTIGFTNWTPVIARTVAAGLESQGRPEDSRVAWSHASWRR